MKYLILIAIFAIGWLIATNNVQSPTLSTQIKEITSITSIPTPELNLPHQFVAIPYQDTTVSVAWFEKTQNMHVTLITNYQEKRTAKSIIESSKCQYAINAGFYTAEDSPIGLLIIDGTIQNQFQKNQTLNGIFSLDENDNPEITEEIREFPKLAIQAGPMLIRNRKIMLLELQNDEFSRRSVVGISNSGRIFFISVYDSDNIFKGPLLKDTPEIISSWASQQNITLTDALNLDGGSASIYYDGKIMINELTPVGSILCLKN